MPDIKKRLANGNVAVIREDGSHLEIDPGGNIIGQSPSATESFFRGAGQGATFGFGDEATGAIRSGAQGILDLIYGNQQGNFGENYKTYRDEVRRNERAAREANPKSYIGGEFSGGLLAGLIPGTQGTSIPRLTAIGGTYGLGSSEAQNFEGLARDTAIGAGLGAILPSAAKYAGKTIGAGVNAVKSGEASLGKKAITSFLGPSEEAINALLKDPSVAEASIEGVTKTLPNVAGKFDLTIKELNSKAKEVLSTSRYIQPSGTDPGGAFTKDEVFNTVNAARKKLGGIYTDEAKAAAGTLQRISGNLEKIRSTVSQNQVHNLIQDLDNEIPWDKVWRSPESLTATDRALIDTRDNLDKILKTKNLEYAELMKPVSEAIQGRREFTKKFGIQRVKGEGYVPSDQAYSRTRTALNEGKIDTQRVLANTKNLIGEDLSPTIEKARFGEEFSGGKTHGSRNVNIGMGIGTAAGGGVGGLLGIPWIGAGVGGAAGASVGSYIDKKGADIARNIVLYFAQNQPSKLGKYAPIFEKAIASGGTEAAVVPHLILIEADPQYRKMVDNLTREAGKDFPFETIDAENTSIPFLPRKAK